MREPRRKNNAARKASLCGRNRIGRSAETVCTDSSVERWVEIDSQIGFSTLEAASEY